MSLVGLATLFSGSDETGHSLLAGVGSEDTYSQLTNSYLASQNMLDAISSGELDCSVADLNLICFSSSDYTGSFFQISLSGTDGSSTFWHTGPAQSALLVASNKAGANEHRVSFVNSFRDQWNSFLDGQLQGTKVSRDVNPTLTWQMFPTNNQWLDASQTYLRIHQPLHVHLPWYWPDYQASMDYNIVLFVNGNGQLRAWVADWECWVESGAKSGKIYNELSPQVEAGISPLQDQLNQALALTDLLDPIKGVMFLPGWQPEAIGTAVFGGDTDDDITIIVQN